MDEGSRHRRSIDDAGELAVVDRGDAARVLADVVAATAEVRRVLLAGGYERGVAMIDDPDLADQPSSATGA